MDQLLGIVGFCDKGNFVLGESYEYLNMVYDGDKTYYARKDNQGVALNDIETWRLLSRMGADGKNIELRTNASYVQWRKEGDETWNNLIPTSDLKGADGKQLEIRTDSGYIQTRLTDGVWTNLIEISTLKGDRGPEGKGPIVLPNGNYGNWDETSQDYIDSGIEASATVDLENVPVPFTEASTRESINSNENVPTIFGKIKKWFTDFGTLAWKSKVDYQTDIDNKPAIPTKTSEITNDSGFTTSTSVTSKINQHNSDVAAHADIRTSLDNKVDKESGKGLYPDTDATKLAGIETGAQKNIKSIHKSASVLQADWVDEGGIYSSTINDSDVTEEKTVVFAPSNDTEDLYIEAEVYTYGTTSNGSLKLKSRAIPAGNLTINYSIIN